MTNTEKIRRTQKFRDLMSNIKQSHPHCALCESRGVEEMFESRKDLTEYIGCSSDTVSVIIKGASKKYKHIKITKL